MNAIMCMSLMFMDHHGTYTYSYLGRIRIFYERLEMRIPEYDNYVSKVPATLEALICKTFLGSHTCGISSANLNSVVHCNTNVINLYFENFLNASKVKLFYKLSHLVFVGFSCFVQSG